MKPVLYSEGGSLEQSKYLKLYYNNGPKANYYFPSDIELRTPSIFCPMQGSAIPWKLIFFQGLLSQALAIWKTIPLLNLLCE